MTESVIEEFNPWSKAITSTDSATVLLLVFWIILGALRWHDKLAEIEFARLILESSVVTALLKVITNNN